MEDPAESSGGSEVGPKGDGETEVEVHVGYSGTWERGFSVAESLPDGLRLRRRSDLQVLPGVFGHEKVRPVSN